jgi:HK97 family phage prohead protease
MNKANIEYRTKLTKIELRELPDEATPGGKVLAGYAARFGELSEDLGGYREMLAPGCFAKSLQANDVRAFFNHDFNHLLGRTKSGTLRLTEDSEGLAFEVDLADNSLSEMVYSLVKRGDLDGVSFGFYAIQDQWNEDGTVNTILEADLIEISPVVFPAYQAPKVEARSLDRLSRRPDPNQRRIERANKLIELLKKID